MTHYVIHDTHCPYTLSVNEDCNIFVMYASVVSETVLPAVSDERNSYLLVKKSWHLQGYIKRDDNMTIMVLELVNQLSPL